MSYGSLEELRARLDAARGQWPVIARDTGVGYYTIARVARGVATNPTIGTVEAISAWLDEHHVERVQG